MTTGGMVWGIESTPVPTGPQMVRTATVTGCPKHDACHGWTRECRAARRAEAPWSDPYCPIHVTEDCPGTSA